jgi:hypothetical protein
MLKGGREERDAREKQDAREESKMLRRMLSAELMIEMLIQLIA